MKFEIKKHIIVMGIVVAAMIAAAVIMPEVNMHSVGGIINTFGVLAPIAYIIIMFFAIIISPIPSLPLVVLAAGFFGPFLAAIYSIIGAMIGAVAAFFISKVFARDVIQEYYKDTVKKLDKYNENYLALVIFGTRLIPLFNFDVISYASGLTKVRFWKFAAATLFGMIPMTFLFAYSGKVLFAGNAALTVILSIALFYILYKSNSILKYIKKFI